MVGALQRLLRDDTRLLQQVGLDVSAGQLARSAEVDTDELSLGDEEMTGQQRGVI